MLEPLRDLNGIYRSSDKKAIFLSKIFPSLSFYAPTLMTVLRAYSRIGRSKFAVYEWSSSCLEVFYHLEKAGVKTEVLGLANIRDVKGPCVIVANHMSSLETLVLAGVIGPYKDSTYVVKSSLLKIPVLNTILRSREVIVVNRVNPREDLSTVLNEGTRKISEGKSIVVFPQSSRSLDFNSERFNTIGVKLARKADVPVVPIALKTDAWQSGKFVKDLGRINPCSEVHFAFGEPLRIKGNGREEHRQIVEFICKHLAKWGVETN